MRLGWTRDAIRSEELDVERVYGQQSEGDGGGYGGPYEAHEALAHHGAVEDGQNEEDEPSEEGGDGQDLLGHEQLCGREDTDDGARLMGDHSSWINLSMARMMRGGMAMKTKMSLPELDSSRANVEKP